MLNEYTITASQAAAAYNLLIEQIAEGNFDDDQLKMLEAVAEALGHGDRIVITPDS